MNKKIWSCSCLSRNLFLIIGFSSNPNTWLPVDESFKTLNVEAQKAASRSNLKSFLKITSLREWPAVRSGSLHTELVNEEILFFSR